MMNQIEPGQTKREERPMAAKNEVGHDKLMGGKYSKVCGKQSLIARLKSFELRP